MGCKRCSSFDPDCGHAKQADRNELAGDFTKHVSIEIQERGCLVALVKKLQQLL